jgi:hypothetical protein
MIPLSYYTSLWQKMLFDCLSSVCPMLLSKGQLHSTREDNFIPRLHLLL